MTWNIVTVAFGDKKYKKGQKFLDRHSQKCDANFIAYNDVLYRICLWDIIRVRHEFASPPSF